MHLRKTILLFLFLLAALQCHASIGFQETPDSIPTYNKEELEIRFGKRTAKNILNNTIAIGYSHDMVYLAKGIPYLIEEPLGKFMDFDIYFYPDCVVFFEFGAVTHIKRHKTNTK